MFERRIAKKGKVKDENWKFYDDWEDLYFFFNIDVL